jgi:hypothetical protein
MNSFTQSIMDAFNGAIKATGTFPAAILNAFAFAIVTMIRIQLDWPQQEAYNFLFNCLHWSFALGAIVSMALIVFAQSRYKNNRAFITANLLGVAIAVITLLILYFFGELQTGNGETRYSVISNLAAARVSVAILISFLLFVIAAGYPRDKSDFSRSFFMTHKAFFVAIIYGIVIMAGVSGVAGAVQALLYNEMSEKVYMYIATLTGFLAFTIFLGYFPEFKKGINDDHRETAQKQPRYIEVLFVYIMIPIMLALTIVLFLWAGRTIFTGTWPSFVRLAGIATSYSFAGLWLHIMVTHHKSGLAKFYRRFYPFAALIILAFEAGALVSQINKFGVKFAEYSFALVWVVAVISAILLLVLRAKSHIPITAMICVAAVISVLPLVWYHALPVASQVDRLEKLLIEENMLENGQMVPAAKEPELSVRESITDAVFYIAYAENPKLPEWFDTELTALSNTDTFKEKLGFEPVWPKTDDGFYGGTDYLGTFLYLKTQPINVSDYDWMINILEYGGKEIKSAKVTGENGVYEIEWVLSSADGVPSLRIKLDGRVILEHDMNDYINRISVKYPPSSKTGLIEANLDDMSVKLENEEVSVLIVFNNVDINLDPRTDKINYWLNMNMLYFKEKQRELSL